MTFLNNNQLQQQMMKMFHWVKRMGIITKIVKRLIWGGELTTKMHRGGSR